MKEEIAMDTSKLKPFDLEAALAGKPVVTRDGRHVSQIVQMKIQSGTLICAVVADHEVITYDAKGSYWNVGQSSLFDLFMAPTERTLWFNVYRNKSAYIATGSLFDSEAEAMKHHYSDFISTHSITVSE